MKRVRVGQIGIGHNHGAEKMRTVRKFPELFEVIGYAEENERWIEKRGSHPAYEGLERLSVDEVIARSDLVFIESDVWEVPTWPNYQTIPGRLSHPLSNDPMNDSEKYPSTYQTPSIHTQTRQSIQPSKNMR